MKDMSNVKAMTFGAICIAINIVLGTVVDLLKIPLLFLDTLGTIFGAVTLGPLYGAIIGGLTNVVQGAITNPRTIPFALVNIAVGLVVGFIAKKYGFKLKTAIITGLIISVVAPMIGTPIAIFLFEGITGDFNDVLFTALKNGGATIFSSAFIPRITSNLVDKIACCAIVSLLYPKVMKALKTNAAK